MACRKKARVVGKGLEERNGEEKQEEKDGANRQGVIVKVKESANKYELEIEMVKQKLCVQARRQWSYSALSQQQRDYLAKFPLANNNSPQVPVEAILCRDGDPPCTI